MTACNCMTEDPDGTGERVVTHSTTCPESPEYATPMSVLYYKGRRILNDDKLGETFQHAETGEPLVFKPKKRLYLVIGQAYDIDEVREGSFSLSSAKANREVGQHADAATWRALAAAAEDQDEARKAEARITKAAKEGNKDIGELTLGELREMFARAMPDQKAALMTVITRYVRPY